MEVSDGYLGDHVVKRHSQKLPSGRTLPTSWVLGFPSRECKNHATPTHQFLCTTLEKQGEVLLELVIISSQHTLWARLGHKNVSFILLQPFRNLTKNLAKNLGTK